MIAAAVISAAAMVKQAEETEKIKRAIKHGVTIRCAYCKTPDRYTLKDTTCRSCGGPLKEGRMVL